MLGESTTYKNGLSVAALACVCIVWWNLDDWALNLLTGIVVTLVGLIGLFSCHVGRWFQSFSGIFSMAMFFQTFVFQQLHLLTAQLSMDAYIDSQENLYVSYLLAVTANFIAVLVIRPMFRRTKESSSNLSYFLQSAESKLEKCGTTKLLLALTGLMIVIRKYVPGSAPIVEYLFVLLIYVGSRSVVEKRASRFLVSAMVGSVVVSIWISDGLSGMKASLVAPLIHIILACLAFKIRIKKMWIVSFATVFLVVALVATAIQGLRVMGATVSQEQRAIIAVAMIEGFLIRTFHMEISNPISDQQLLSQFSKSSGDEKEDRTLLLKRSSVLSSDIALLEAFYRKSGLEYGYFFEAFRFIPKSVENVEAGNSSSAYFGRYAEIWSQQDYISGLTVSGPLVWFIYWGGLGVIFNYFILNLLTQLVGNSVFAINSLATRAFGITTVFVISEDSGFTLFKYLYRLFPFSILFFAIAAAIVLVLNKLLNSNRSRVMHGRADISRNYAST